MFPVSSKWFFYGFALFCLFLSAYKDLQSREHTRNAAWQHEGWDEAVYYTGTRTNHCIILTHLNSLTLSCFCIRCDQFRLHIYGTLEVILVIGCNILNIKICCFCIYTVRCNIANNAYVYAANMLPF